MEVVSMVKNLISEGASAQVLERAVLFVVAFILVRKEIRALFKITVLLLKNLNRRMLRLEEAKGLPEYPGTEDLWKDV